MLKFIINLFFYDELDEINELVKERLKEEKFYWNTIENIMMFSFL